MISRLGKKENMDKRPKKWKNPGKEKTIFDVELKKNEKIIEYGWAVEDLETTLMDPDIWIADIGATVHSTSNVKLAQDWKQETNNTVIVMGNGQKEEVTKPGKATCTIKILKEEFKATSHYQMLYFYQMIATISSASPNSCKVNGT
jgi:hypothetical protein